MEETEDDPAFGRRVEEFVNFGVIEFHPERLDNLIEARLKAIWLQMPCPKCGERSINTRPGSTGVWCRKCHWNTVYTNGTPFHHSQLSPGELVLAFVLYADSLFSMLQLARLLSFSYKSLRTNLRELEAAFERGFPVVWDRIAHTINGPTQIDETGHHCAGFKGMDPPRDGLSRHRSGPPGRSRWEGAPGDTMTVVAARRDVLCVIQAHPGQSHDELKPVLEETASLSQTLGEVWRDEYSGYDPLDYNYRTVKHAEEFVTDDGVHINQVECLWSLLGPWLQKFRGLSKPSLEQAVRTYGFVRSLNLVGAPIHSLIDCFAVNIADRAS